jgi:hypothetical protein
VCLTLLMMAQIITHRVIPAQIIALLVKFIPLMFVIFFASDYKGIMDTIIKHVA